MNEKLIEIGEFIHKSLLNGSSKTNPAFDEAMLLFVCNSLSLLKEQEAHVLTLDEAIDGNGCYYVEFQYHQDMGWVKCDFSRMYLDGEVAMLFTRDKNFYQQKENYGQCWRLWNKRPTYDQRQAVKWDDD